MLGEAGALVLLAQRRDACALIPFDACLLGGGLPCFRFRESYISAKFGPEIAEIETLDEDLATVKAAHDLALNELRANSGMSEQAFTTMVKKVTFEIDGV
jgi:hypothetical protein